MKQTLYQQNVTFFDKARTEMPQDIIDLIEGGWDWLKDSNLNENVLEIGTKAPEFSLPDALGRPVSLNQLLKTGPVILTFYRGGWCPFCNIQLRNYQSILPQIRAAGTQLVAVTPERPSEAEKTIAKNEIDIPVITDHGNQLAEQYGLKIRVSVVRLLKPSWFKPCGSAYS